jgi:hypothetical protein
MEIAGRATWRFPETLAGENPHTVVDSARYSTLSARQRAEIAI